jgi:hypothetical protein
MPRRTNYQEPGATGLSYRQAMLLQGVLPVMLVSVLLPIGLICFFLALRAMPISDAFSHGELFLAGGNAAFAGCIVLVAARPDEALNAAIAAIFSLVLLVLPCYGIWAFISVGLLDGDAYVKSLVEVGGGAWATAGVIVSMAFVRYAYRPN